MPIRTQHADRSARRHAPWTATVIIAAGLLLVAACTSGTPHPSASPPVSSAGTSTSAGTVPPAAVDSQTVYDRLGRRPITAAELPAGMAAEAPHVESAGGPPGALGAIGVKFDDTQPSASDFTVLIYGVFTTGSAAQAAYQQGPAAVLNPRDHTVISSASTTPVGGPTTLSHVRVTDIARHRTRRRRLLLLHRVGRQRHRQRRQRTTRRPPRRQRHDRLHPHPDRRHPPAPGHKPLSQPTTGKRSATRGRTDAADSPT